VEPFTRSLPPPDPRSLCPLSSTKFVEPHSEKNPGVTPLHPEKKISGYATALTPNKIPGYSTAINWLLLFKEWRGIAAHWNQGVGQSCSVLMVWTCTHYLLRPHAATDKSSVLRRDGHGQDRGCKGRPAVDTRHTEIIWREFGNDKNASSHYLLCCGSYLFNHRPVQVI
jgi:hypothetical protein